jgi:hypothetical protein
MIGLLFMSLSSKAQDKEIEQREQTWLGYFNQTRFTNRSGVWFDAHLRHTDKYVKRTSLVIGRIGYVYFVTDQTRITFGYSFANHYGYGGSPDYPEHRPWQQIQWFEKKKGFNLMQWLRVEQRFRKRIEDNELMNDYNFNWRLRYNFAVSIPLTGQQIIPQTPFVFINNEVHINAGSEISVNYFDQNRFFTGIGYQFSPHVQAHLGYMNVFQQLSTSGKFVNIHAIRLFVFHNIDFRNKTD